MRRFGFRLLVLAVEPAHREGVEKPLRIISKGPNIRFDHFAVNGDYCEACPKKCVGLDGISIHPDSGHDQGQGVKLGRKLRRLAGMPVSGTGTVSYAHRRVLGGRRQPAMSCQFFQIHLCPVGSSRLWFAGMDCRGIFAPRNAVLSVRAAPFSSEFLWIT